MNLHFYKYQGTGNDFVILDNRTGIYNSLSTDQIKFLCDRRFGIGGDGLMMLNIHPEYDFEMKYFNADGARSSMCGNGGRCLTKFAHDVGLVRDIYNFIAVDGPHEALISPDGFVNLRMNDVHSIKKEDGNYILNTGSPHFVSMEDNVKELNVFEEGRKIRYNETYRSEGINVNFVEKLDKGIFVRTYERGVEDETYSCGTGVTAAALVSEEFNLGFNEVNIFTKGGPLRVKFEKTNDNQFENIWLCGPAVRVFEGDIQLT